MRNLCLGLLLCGLGTSITVAADPVTRTDLFTAGEQGYALYRIPGVVVTAQGTVLAYCEARKSEKGDWGHIDIVMRRSTDGGSTWSPMKKVVELTGTFARNPAAVAQKLGREGEVTINNPVAIADRSGAVHLLFCVEYGRCFYQRSDDDGLSWTKPVDITPTFDEFKKDYDWIVLATGPGHGIQLQSGRLVVPVWLSLGTGGHAHRPSVTATIYSDDHGATWRRGDIAVPNTDEWINPNETIAVELSDGSVMLNVRSESHTHRRLIVVSPNGATNWSEPKFDDALLEPICFASLVRLPSDAHPDTLIFSNPHNLERRSGTPQPGQGRDRANLTLHLSPDGGRTWTARRTLEAGPSGYSDLAVGPDQSIYCLYERGSLDSSFYKTKWLTLARLKADWITAEQ